jgi:hypothetical protein
MGWPKYYNSNAKAWQGMHNNIIYYIIKTTNNQRWRFVSVRLRRINGGDLSTKKGTNHKASLKSRRNVSTINTHMNVSTINTHMQFGKQTHSATHGLEIASEYTSKKRTHIYMTPRTRRQQTLCYNDDEPDKAISRAWKLCTAWLCKIPPMSWRLATMAISRLRR